MASSEKVWIDRPSKKKAPKAPKKPKYKSMRERREIYMSPPGGVDMMESIAAGPTLAEMDAADAKDPKEWFEIKIREEEAKASGMMKGGMARGRGNKMYEHNYATGGSVTDHLGSKK
tara:strand:- start:209 stop:559 length:351 start_codon:yes stop_codon:yes gene_type:complete